MGRTSPANEDGRILGAAWLVPVGGSPTGTGGSPVLPIFQTRSQSTRSISGTTDALAPRLNRRQQREQRKSSLLSPLSPVQARCPATSGHHAGECLPVVATAAGCFKGRRGVFRRRRSDRASLPCGP